MRYLPIALITLLCTLALTSCHDDDDIQPIVPTPEGEWKVSVLGGSAADVDDEGAVFFGREATYGSLRLQLDGYDRQRDGQIRLTLDEGSEWLTIKADTLGNEGIIRIATKENTDDSRRTATLRLTATNGMPPRETTITVSQRSRADQSANGSAKEDLYVGYGYDIYKALDNPMSVRVKTPIIELEKLRKAGSSVTFETVHDSRMSRTEMKYACTTSLQQYSEKLTQMQSESGVTIEGCVEDCEKAASFVSNVREQNFGRGSIIKTVGARVIDKAALLNLREHDRLPYSTEFFNRINSLLTLQALHPDELKAEVIKTLEEFGTHIVLQADLGGRIDYTFAMRKSGSVNYSGEMAEEIDYTIGRTSSNQRSTEYVKNTSMKKSADGAITVTGGSQATKTRLETDITKLDETSQLPPSHVNEWLASIEYSERAIATGDIDVVHFELMPLWDLVPDKLRIPFLNATLDMVQRPDCKVSDEVLGTDLYRIDCTRADLFDFSKVGDKGSLCRILYLKSGEKQERTPILQVCSEYVPKIRTDQRVTVAYPIYKRKIRMNEGIFIGDGIHKPAYVGFGGADCFVAPFDGLKNTDIIKELHYANGSLLIGDGQIKYISEDARDRTVRDDVLPILTSGDYGGYHVTPIVKIGSCFWPRQDIDYEMFFADSEYGYSEDQIEDGVLYARLQWSPNYEFLTYNDWIFGYAPNTAFPGDPNLKWYLPLPDDVKNLHAYIGFNPKALFKGQVSGFNAQFNGYYGWNDVLNGNQYYSDDDWKLRHKGDANFISTKCDDGWAGACAMVITKDYELRTIDDNTYPGEYAKEWRDNFYPVRPVRGWMFNYPTLNEIEEHKE